MTVEEWTVSETRRFEADVAHYGIARRRVDLWIANLRANPLIGSPAAMHGNLAVYDYAVEDFVVRYLAVPDLQKVQLMALYPAAELEETSPERAKRLAGRGREIAIDLARIIGVLKP